ncbi:MAG: lysophospholipid acyltransferase family protein [Alphaproteobacteria bacterium]|jgi:1-acyl-sn-glycerol-3-phosphate acyltransferase
MGSAFRALVRSALFLGWTLLLLPIQVAAVALRLPLAVTIPLVYHGGCLRIIGLKLETHGRMARVPATLFVANHASYLDTAVLGALIPGSFIAKREIAGWPLFGLMAKLQRSVFVDRGTRRDIHAQSQELRRRLEAGDNLILFPEGTSNDGNRTLPFKSALFNVAELETGGRPITVQPVSVAYTRLDGLPLGRGLRPYYAWYGDMELLPHMWKMLGLGTATVEVEFHPPVTLAEFDSRKTLSDHCRRVIAHGLANAISGRPAGEEESQGSAGAAAAPADALGRTEAALTRGG